MSIELMNISATHFFSNSLKLQFLNPSYFYLLLRGLLNAGKVITQHIETGLRGRGFDSLVSTSKVALRT